MNEQNFIQLCSTLASIDLFGSRPPAPPWGEGHPAVSPVQAAIELGRQAVPLAYDSAFIDPLEHQLRRIVAASTSDPTLLETLGGTVYQHAKGYLLAKNLERFLAVVSNLYRSFLDRQKRAHANFPIRESFPPLATFAHRGDYGPFTLPVDSVQQLFGGSVGVVSLPATYADDSVLWASLAHETGGHDVVHADQGLLEELQAGVGNALKETSVPSLGASDLATRQWVSLKLTAAGISAPPVPYWDHAKAVRQSPNGSERPRRVHCTVSDRRGERPLGGRVGPARRAKGRSGQGGKTIPATPQADRQESGRRTMEEPTLTFKKLIA